MKEFREKNNYVRPQTLVDINNWYLTYMSLQKADAHYYLSNSMHVYTCTMSTHIGMSGIFPQTCVLKINGT